MARPPVLSPFHSRTQMRVLLAIFEEGSATHAAVSLDASQPQVSRVLGEVEAQLGVRLFERSRQGMRATVAGMLVVSHARKILHAMDDADRELDEYRAKLGGGR